MPEWYKSSYSGGDNNCVEVTHAPVPSTSWHTASYSGAHGECVEVAALADSFGIRDTKHHELGALFFSADEWRAFLIPAQNSLR